MPGNPTSDTTPAIPGPAHDPQMIDALREKMSALGLDAIIVPHANRYQSEYLPAGDERLLRLSGFSGSAGTAIVTAGRAVLFVDGRYHVQAALEVDEKVFEIIKSGKTPAAKWLGQNIGDGARVGYDPWLFTCAQLQVYSTELGERAELVALEPNPIDELWPERPDAPAGLVRALDAAYAGLGVQAKIKIITDTFRGRFDAQFIGAGESISWLFNIRGDDVPFSPLVLGSCIVFADGRAKLFVEPGRINEKILAHMGPGVEVLAPSRLGDEIDALVRAGAMVRLAAENTPAWVAERIINAGGKSQSVPDPCQLPRAKKNMTEISGIRDAHIRDGVALTRFLAWLALNHGDGGLDEIAASEKLESFRRQHELYLGPSFPTISGSGTNGAIVHYRATAASNRQMQAGELYLVDSGGQYLDGTTDVTRTVAIGKPSDEMKDRFTRVLKGNINLSAQAFPTGTAGQELDAIARRHLWDVGLDYDHGTGHGVGHYLSVHEGPQRIARLGPRIALEPGMVLSIEPGYYRQGGYGIRIENLAVVTASPLGQGLADGLEMLGFEILTMAPIDRALIIPEMLSPTEARWLDEYHARVFETLGPFMNTDEKSWLAEATRPV